MVSLFKKPALKKAQKIELHDLQFSSIKDQLRKKNKAKAKAEAVVMEWYVNCQLISEIIDFLPIRYSQT